MTAEAFATVPRMPSAPLFADDNSSVPAGRPARRAGGAAAEERRREIMATLRRLKEEAGDPAALAARERPPSATPTCWSATPPLF